MNYHYDYIPINISVINPISPCLYSRASRPNARRAQQVRPDVQTRPRPQATSPASATTDDRTDAMPNANEHERPWRHATGLPTTHGRAARRAGGAQWRAA